MMKDTYKRVLVKISGEALAGSNGHGLDYETLKRISVSLKKVYELGVEIGIVVGGGNFWRGRQHESMDRTTADHIGMLATTMNALALADAIQEQGVPTRVMTAIEMRSIAEPYIRGRAVRHFEKNRIIVFGAGTGNPFFSTDTAAALRAAEIEADVIMKATNVDGVYDKDPHKFPDAVKYDELTYLDVINRQLGVMDYAAISLCMENKIPILVFNLNDPDNIFRAVTGEKIGTTVKE
ncbi:MAG: UMP kinase [Clostridia bacterium]|nr:UMP kinase [Clostridia bacterium]MBR5943087.1 UMP kinase [Clostridia bacterium]